MRTSGVSTGSPRSPRTNPGPSTGTSISLAKYFNWFKNIQESWKEGVDTSTDEVRTGLLAMTPGQRRVRLVTRSSPTSSRASCSSGAASMLGAVSTLGAGASCPGPGAGSTSARTGTGCTTPVCPSLRATPGQSSNPTDNDKTQCSGAIVEVIHVLGRQMSFSLIRILRSLTHPP